MKNITVSVDEGTYRNARIRAAELDTSVSALVRDYLRTLAAAQAGGEPGETSAERRSRLLREVIEKITANGGGCAWPIICPGKTSTTKRSTALMRFVDTNVLLYAVSALSEEAGKSDRALALLRQGNWPCPCRYCKSSTIRRPVPAVRRR